MDLKNKKKAERITTPRGISIYPKLTRPDVKFKPEGEFTCRLALEAKEAAALIARIKPLYEAGYTDELGKLKAKTIKKADKPWKDEVDEEGNPTGKIVFNFKQRAKFKAKDGKEINIKIAVFDAKGQPLLPEVADKIGSGSVLKISFEVRPFCTPAIGYGITLSLKAAQVIELVEYGGGGNATSYGFEQEEDGFDGTPAHEEGFDSETPASEETAGEGTDAESPDF